MAYRKMNQSKSYRIYLEQLPQFCQKEFTALHAKIGAMRSEIEELRKEIQQSLSNVDHEGGEEAEQVTDLW